MGKLLHFHPFVDLRPVTFSIGGALIGLIFFQTETATIIGGLIGFVISSTLK